MYVTSMRFMQKKSCDNIYTVLAQNKMLLVTPLVVSSSIQPSALIFLNSLFPFESHCPACFSFNIVEKETRSTGQPPSPIIIKISAISINLILLVIFCSCHFHARSTPVGSEVWINEGDFKAIKS